MRLSEIQGEKAITTLADLLDPIETIFADMKVVAAFRDEKTSKMKKAKVMLKEHPKEVIEIMAIMDGETPETYNVNLLTLPKKLVELLNEPELASLFQSRGQMTEDASSGSAQGNIEA